MGILNKKHYAIKLVRATPCDGRVLCRYRGISKVSCLAMDGSKRNLETGVTVSLRCVLVECALKF